MLAIHSRGGPQRGTPRIDGVGRAGPVRKAASAPARPASDYGGVTLRIDIAGLPPERVSFAASPRGGAAATCTTRWTFRR